MISADLLRWNSARIAGVNAANQPREITVKPGAWLSQRQYDLTTIVDGQNAQSFDSASRSLAADSEFRVKMLPRGGFVAALKPK